MVILPMYEEFEKKLGSTLPYYCITQAKARLDEITNNELVDESMKQYGMAFLVSEELLKTYHSWLVQQLASPDTVQI